VRSRPPRPSYRPFPAACPAAAKGASSAGPLAAALVARSVPPSAVVRSAMTGVAPRRCRRARSPTSAVRIVAVTIWRSSSRHAAGLPLQVKTSETHSLWPRLHRALPGGRTRTGMFPGRVAGGGCARAAPGSPSRTARAAHRSAPESPRSRRPPSGAGGRCRRTRSPSSASHPVRGGERTHPPQQVTGIGARGDRGGRHPGG